MTEQLKPKAGVRDAPVLHLEYISPIPPQNPKGSADWMHYTPAMPMSEMHVCNYFKLNHNSTGPKKQKKKQNWALSPSLTASVARWLGLKVWKLSLHLQEHNALNNIISLHLPLDCFTGVEQTRVHPIWSIPILRDQTVIRPSQNRRCSYSSSIRR